MDSQFTTMGMEMQTMRRQIESMMQQFSSMASNLHKVTTATVDGSSSSDDKEKQHQATPHSGDIQPRTIRLDFHIFSGNDSTELAL